jgi:methyl-accepting chemotaxis protein
MSIKRMTVIGATSIAAMFLVGMALAGSAINQIRFGGPIQTRSQQANDLLADILPPPSYIIEPYLETTRIIRDPRYLGDGKARLADLKRQYHERHEYWSNSDLETSLKSQVETAIHEPAEQFWREAETSFLPAVDRGDLSAAEASYARLSRAYFRHRASVDKLVADNSAYAAGLKVSAASSLTWALGEITAIALILLLAIGGAVWWVTRKIVNPLADTAKAMHTMAGGDYSVTIHGAERADEIGSMAKSVEVFRTTGLEKQQSDEAVLNLVVAELADGLQAWADGNLQRLINIEFGERYEPLRIDFNNCVIELSRIVSKISETAQSVNTGSNEIRTASDDLARRTEQQAATLEETAAALSMVTSAMRDTADKAISVSTTVSTTHAEANDGAKIVEQVVSAMGDIEKSAQEMATIIAVIEGISFQTNLLALNAGVEAARAGDSGKGFAVVANEVRALAQRSADAAKEIRELIAKSSSLVGRGVSLVGQTGDMLGRILEKVAEISPMVGEISTSAQTQASSLGQINIAVNDIDKMTQQNAAMVEQSTASASNLAEEASALSKLVSHFQTNSMHHQPATALVAKTGAATTATITAKPKARQHVAVHGNLALKSPPPGDDDWSEF